MGAADGSFATGSNSFGSRPRRRRGQSARPLNRAQPRWGRFMTEATQDGELRASAGEERTSELEREVLELQQDLAEERRRRELLEQRVEAQRRELERVESDQ